MLFQDLASYLEKLEKTTSRNEITKILGDLFINLSVEEIGPVCYLSLGKLRPSYESLEFNLAEKMIAEVLSRISQKTKEEINKDFNVIGDWGDLASNLIKRKKSNLTINDVYHDLLSLAKIEGFGSQESKINKLLSLLSQMDCMSAKYVLRIILKKLRLGFSDMTILNSLSFMEVGDKSLRKEIEKSYNIVADIGKVASYFKAKGVKGLEELSIIPGIPILPSAAERLPNATKIFEKIGVCLLEPKIDGFRLQVHLDKSRTEIVDNNSLFTQEEPFMRFFSRNLEDMTGMFPEIKKVVSKFSCESLILEGEAVAYDHKNNRFLPFQLTISRKRKYDIQEKSTEIPLTLFVFDLLYLDGKSYINKPFIDRRKILEKLIPNNVNNLQLIPQQKAISAQDIATYFLTKKKAGLEGIMAKVPKSHYEAGSRGFHWIKYKREEGQGLEDSIDVVVLGYYYGQGKRTNFGIGALLVGVYNERKEVFESIAKIGTGIKDEEFLTIKKDCDLLKRKIQPKNVVVPKALIPDLWIEPQIVAVVLSDEITRSPLHAAGANEDGKGYALRFPRLITWSRKDKSVYDITTVSEIEKLYQNQSLKSSIKSKEK